VHETLFREVVQAQYVIEAIVERLARELELLRPLRLFLVVRD
jgi:hypothetical protein